MNSEVRTFRVIVRGEFRDLSEAQRDRLRAELDQHDLLTSGYPESGSLSYDAELRPFTVRCQVVQPADRPDQEATDTGTLVAIELLERAELGYDRLRTSATCLEDVKVNRPKARR
ncbi:hypothetical protein FB561_1377 [Kribbella amoyensis]|uniref:Uncharacterized protein n=1 Tax=Kribbella amoyensis TaxID=996641 RepID=A0A561BN91_9ACTN|nr:DUF6204 family protein [Kribbella amoyensis]TWD80304.1 hypothetical protein FB561_1377 [Kribbella amoyensis]